VLGFLRLTRLSKSSASRGQLAASIGLGALFASCRQISTCFKNLLASSISMTIPMILSENHS